MKSLGYLHQIVILYSKKRVVYSRMKFACEISHLNLQR